MVSPPATSLDSMSLLLHPFLSETLVYYGLVVTEAEQDSNLRAGENLMK
jgi:hypothetical protein